MKNGTEVKEGNRKLKLFIKNVKQQQQKHQLLLCDYTHLHIHTQAGGVHLI